MNPNLQRESRPRYWVFNQLNTDDRWIVDQVNGISLHVFIEASKMSDANRKAKEIGIYFDGVNQGIDCPDCGDRWARAGSVTPMFVSEPEIFGFNTSGEFNHDDKHLFHAVAALLQTDRLTEDDTLILGYVHHADGRIEPFQRPSITVIYDETPIALPALVGQS